MSKHPPAAWEFQTPTLETVLAAHWLNGSRCDCGWRPDYHAPTWWVEQHAAHVAAAIREEGVT